MFAGLRSNVGIIGVGLIGGSIGLRLKFSGFARNVIGIGRNRLRLKKAVDIGAIDEFSTSYKKLKACDLIVICLPVGLIPGAIKDISPYIRRNAIVTDVGSVKKNIVDAWLKQKGKGFLFVPSHPIAGSHFSGIEAADKALFMGKKAIITPYDGIDENALNVVKTMYRFLGMNTLEMLPDEHDRALAYASHLPHIISFVLSDIAQKSAELTEAQSIKDMTRIARSPVSLWSAIVRENKRHVLKACNAFSARFKDQVSYIRSDKGILPLELSAADNARKSEVIAIDGPAGAGKSTIAKGLAKRMNWKLIDTGAMYRAATLACIIAGIELDNIKAVKKVVKAIKIELSDSLPQKVYLNGRDVSIDIRKQEVTDNVFFLAREPKIRDILVSMQKKMAERGNCVIEGRDITTVVVPNARYKFYLDAEFDERLRRREAELKNKGIRPDVSLLNRMIERDANDLCRGVGPLRKASDAEYIDSTSLAIEDVVNIIYYRIKYIKARF